MPKKRKSKTKSDLIKGYACYAIKAESEGMKGFLITSVTRFTLGHSKSFDFQAPLLFPTEEEAEKARKKYQRKMEDRLTVVPVLTLVTTV